MATRWACLGAGKISSDFFKAIRENLPDTEHEFVAVGSKDQSRAQQFADKYRFKRAYGSYENVAKDKDMLEAGKHVLCEKPMAMNYKQAKQVLDFAKSKNLLFVEGMWSRWFPAYDEIRKEISSGTLGDIRLVQVTFCVPIMHRERLHSVELGGGATLDIGIYAVQFACLVFNEMPESITAVEQPFWAPTKIRTPSGVKEFALNYEGYVYENSAGFQYEANAIRDCLSKGLIEHHYVTHRDSEMVHKIMDEVRRQIGMVYPDFD